MLNKNGRHLYVRYIQSPLKSRSNIKDSKIKTLLNELKINRFNYLSMNNVIINSRYLRDKIPKIKRYLQNNVKRIALKIVRIYANSYHVNASSLIEDNNLFRLRIIDWPKNINKILKQLQRIHRYPNFKSLKRSRYKSFITFDFNLTKKSFNPTKYNRHRLLNKRVPLHIKIELLHIPLAKHARIRLASLRKNHKHYMYTFSAIRGRWIRSNRHLPFGRYGAIIIKHIFYHDKEVANHMWIYGKENIKDIILMSRGTCFSFKGWVAKYLKNHNRFYDYRINHIRDAKIIKKK